MKQHAANDNNEVKEAQGEGAAIPTLPAMPIPQKGAPFLEEALSSALKELVLSREVAGKPKRRSRKRTVKKINNPRRMHDKTAKDWDTMFGELVEYKEEHGDCLVSKNHTDNKPLAHWVRGIRERKALLLPKGIVVEITPETVGPGVPLPAKAITAERMEKLDSIGFAWVVTGPRTAWDNRFWELVEFYEEHGKYPSQSMGSVGQWVHKQRRAYARGDVKYEV